MLTKTWPLVLIVAAAAACADQAGNNVAANQTNAAIANQATPADNGAVDGNVASNNAGNAGAERSAAYRALGTEPFWSLTIGGGEMVYDAADVGDLTVAAPAPQPIANGIRYVTPTMTVVITHASCSDGMSDRQYADTVVVTMGAETRNGCGGAWTGSE